VQRSKKILLISHCLLNVNSKVNKLANYQGTLEELIIPLMKKGYGFIQLPCPEMLAYGIKRWGQVKDQYDTPYYRKHVKKLLEPILEQLLDYYKNGYTICGCIGIDGSPNCGVYKTCKAENWEGEIGSINTMPALEYILNSLKEVPEKGIFIEEFQILLNQNKLNLPFFAVDEAYPTFSIQNILKELL